MAAIDPSMALSGPEWNVGSVGTVDQAAPTGGTAGSSGASFGSLLGQLQNTQDQAASASQALATGQASDPTAVVMAVERAQLAMQLASQIRTKAVEAAQDIFHTQV